MRNRYMGGPCYLACATSGGAIFEALQQNIPIFLFDDLKDQEELPLAEEVAWPCNGQALAAGGKFRLCKPI